jgi:hypothetical protein
MYNLFSKWLSLMFSLVTKKANHAKKTRGELEDPGSAKKIAASSTKYSVQSQVHKFTTHTERLQSQCDFRRAEAKWCPPFLKSDGWYRNLSQSRTSCVMKHSSYIEPLHEQYTVRHEPHFLFSSNNDRGMTKQICPG